MPTTTTTYSFNKPVVGADEDDWGGYLNGNWDSVDDLLDGTTPITGIDINSGTLDGVTIGGTTAGAGTFTTLTANTSITGTLATAAQTNITSVGTLTGLTVSGSTSLAGASTSADITFGDNDKAIFGAGSDLQLYHTGSQSVIYDAGTGQLNITTNGSQILLEKEGGDDLARFITDDAVELFYAGAKKFSTTSTGVDVTGTLTSDGLTVDKGSAGTLATFTDGVNSNFVIETASLITTVGNTAGSTSLAFKSSNTERMRIDNSGNVGIGTSSPNNKLTIEGSATLNPYYATYLANSYYDSAWKYAGNGVAWGIGNNFGGVASGTTIAVASSNSSGSGAALTWNPAFNIDSSGNVGIGTSSPSQLLHVNSTGNVAAAQIQGASHTAKISTDGAGTIFGTTTNGYMLFSTNSAERMRIDTSGNLLVGTTNTFPAGNNVVGTAIRPDGDISITKDGDIAIFANRKTSDGDIMQFRKDGTAVGSIGSVSDKIYIGSSAGGDTFLRLNSNTVAPASSSGADRDATINLGYSGARFQNLLLSGGVYLGGTGSANKLDDYEEGTWTPNVGGVAVGGAATYIKIGEFVHINIDITAAGGISATNQITNLPFTVKTGYHSAFAVGYTNSGIEGGYFDAGTTIMKCIVAGNTTPDNINAGERLILFGTYRTNA